MSLEVVDHTKDGHLFTVPPAQEEKIEHNPLQNQSFTSQYAPPFAFHQVSGNSPLEDRRFMRLRRTNTWLLVAAIFALVLAIVAAAVGGSLAANRQNQIKSLQTQLLSTPNNTVALPANDTAPSSAPARASLALVNNCTSYTSPYLAGSGGEYTVHCGMDQTGGSAPDILGVYVYTFSDCINACSSYNAQSIISVRTQQTSVRPNGSCVAVAWNRALPMSEGNCWLKPAIQADLSVNATVDVARINT